MNSSLEQQLAAGIDELGLSLDTAVVAQLLAFVGLLQKWNKTYNLTAIRQPAEMVSHHVLDSLSVLPVLLPWLQKSALAGRRPGFRDACVTPGAGCSAVPAEQVGQLNRLRFCDVGSGAGLPGLVLAMAQPEWQWTSVDAVDKKAAFQRQACIELGLRNVQVISGRVESVPAAGFDLVISRAFAELSDFVEWSGHLISAGGYLLAMKGVLPEEEITRLPGGWKVSEVFPLRVPGLDVQRHLIVLEKG
jgi:16S rRNA (guanine527-N7)-methyltransferase